ncbi:MAG: hypothetical protein JNM70_17225 [Anaerolineae bacterium]|nr:hypothetical protein [Anaerolineae bacterium]
MHILIGGFIILHGLVHFLYLGHSQRFFELQSGMTWPEGAWLFSRWLGASTVRLLASLALGIAGLALVAGGITLLTGQEGWRGLVTAAALFSAVVFLLFWDGSLRRLDTQGIIGILIDLALVVLALTVQLPAAS